jgi:hypothetical protein
MLQRSSEIIHRSYYQGVPVKRRKIGHFEQDVDVDSWNSYELPEEMLNQMGPNYNGFK